MSGTIDVLVRDRGTSQPITTGVTITATLVSGRIVGTVTATVGGALLSGVSVTAAGPTPWTRTTDAAGFYASPPIDAGTYALTFTRSGYVTKVVPVVVAWGQTTTQNVTLDVAPTGTRVAFQWPLDAYSPFNYPSGQGQVTANPFTGAGDGNWGAAIDNAYFNTQYALGVWKASASDPLRTLRWTQTNPWSILNTDPNSPAYCQGFTNGSVQIRIPDGAHPTLPITYPGHPGFSHDQVMIVLDADGETFHEMYLAAPDPWADWPWSGGVNFRCQDYYKYKIKLDGYGKTPWGNGFTDGDTRCKHTHRAGGLWGIAGILRAGELTNGIKHCMGLYVPPHMMNKDGPGSQNFVWPASSSDPTDFYETTGNVFQGSRMVIPYTTTLATQGFQTAKGLILAECFQKWGGYVVDATAQGNDYVVMGCSEDAKNEIPTSAAWNADVLLACRLLKVMTNDGPGNVGGGGTLLAPLAPAFA